MVFLRVCEINLQRHHTATGDFFMQISLHDDQKNGLVFNVVGISFITAEC